MDRRRRASWSPQSELGGLVKELSPATRDLARLTDAVARSCCRRSTLTSRCARQVILPTGDIVIQRRVRDRRRELQGVLCGRWSALSGEGQNFDGNGIVRALPARRRLAGRLARRRELAHRRAVRQQRRRAARQPPVLSRQAPAVPARACPATRTSCPTSTGRRRPRPARRGRQPTPMKTRDPQAPRLDFVGDHRPDPDRGARVVGASSSNQRLTLPAWVPVIGKDFFEIKAEMHDRPGGHAGPGPDRQHRRRPGRRDHERQARGRHARSSA